MNSTNNAGNMPLPQSNPVDAEILPPTFPLASIGHMINEVEVKMFSSALDRIASTSREALAEIDTITFRTRYRVEIVPDETEMNIKLKK